VNFSRFFQRWREFQQHRCLKVRVVCLEEADQNFKSRGVGHGLSGHRGQSSQCRSSDPDGIRQFLHVDVLIRWLARIALDQEFVNAKANHVFSKISRVVLDNTPWPYRMLSQATVVLVNTIVAAGMRGGKTIDLRSSHLETTILMMDHPTVDGVTKPTIQKSATS